MRRSIFLIGIGLLTLIIIALAALLYVGYQSRQQALIWTHPPRSAVQGDPESLQGLANWEAVAFNTEDGVDIQAWFIPGSDIASVDGGAVILVHGLGGNRVEMLQRATILNRSGYHTLLLDLRNHGESGGDITTLGYSEALDVQAAHTYLEGRDEVDPTKIGVLGHSLGGATVLRAGATIPDIAAVIAESSYQSIPHDADQIMKVLTGQNAQPLLLFFVDQVTGVAASSVNGLEDIQQIAPRPVLIVHGEQDEVILYQDAEALYAAASEPKALYTVPGAGHLDVASHDLAEYERQVIGFLDEYLRGE